MEFAPIHVVRDPGSHDFSGQRHAAIGGFIVELAIVFLASYLLLFSAMTRRPEMYDEGIVLTGAMRVSAGQIPHRDFYFIYGPAEIYILAGLFKLFGTSLLTERAFDLFIKALVVTSVYGILSSYCRKRTVVFISVITVLWLFGLNKFGLATTPVSLLNLIGSILILPVFVGGVSMRRMLAAGAVSGAALLFRYDTGIALLGIHFCVISIAIYLRPRGPSNKLRIFATIFWPYLLGFALLTALPVLYYLSVAPLSPFLHDVILFPGKYYHRSRNLPFPGIQPKTLENLGVYLPIAIAGISLYALIKPRPAGGGNAHQITECRGFLITFELLLLVMYLKGLVRVSPLQVYLATIPSLILLAVLFQNRLAFPRPVRISISCLMWLSLVPATWSALHELRLEELQHSFLEQRPIPGTQTWCRIASPLTGGVCFLPEDDRRHAIEFVISHTRPGELLYSGLSHHDRVVANDNLIYFATQRLPVTKWSHFDPDLQNRYDIQAQMVHELEQNPPPYIVLDSEFDLVREPNDSSRSSGVTLLDNYIHDKYQLSETFGAFSIWRRLSP